MFQPRVGTIPHGQACIVHLSSQATFAVASKMEKPLITEAVWIEATNLEEYRFSEGHIAANRSLIGR
jgi:hypothetical protein